MIARPPESVAYTCNVCGAVTEHPWAGVGQIVERLPYLERSLSELPVRITYDASSLCSALGLSEKPHGGEWGAEKKAPGPRSCGPGALSSRTRIRDTRRGRPRFRRGLSGW